MKYTKNELIEEVARCEKKGTTYREALREAGYNNPLADMLTKEMAQQYSYALMYLNKLHNDKFEREWMNLVELTNEMNGKITNEMRNRAEDYYYVVDCIIKYGKNYHKDII